MLTYVVCPGIVYGRGERELGPLLRNAWEGKPLNVYGDGSNRLPVVHADDLVDSLYFLISTRPTGALRKQRELLTESEEGEPAMLFAPMRDCVCLKRAMTTLLGCRDVSYRCGAGDCGAIGARDRYSRFF